MAKRYFTYINRKLHGPLEAKELSRLPGFGPDVEVTEADHEEFWLPAKKVKSLAPLFAKPASPPKAAARPRAKAAPGAPSATEKIIVCPRCGADIKLEEGHIRTNCPYCDSTLTLGNAQVSGLASTPLPRPSPPRA